MIYTDDEREEIKNISHLTIHLILALFPNLILVAQKAGIKKLPSKHEAMSSNPSTTKKNFF
jgi:hypothetical protein